MREMAPAAARRRGIDGAAVLRQGYAKQLREEEEVSEREKEATKGQGVQV